MVSTGSSARQGHTLSSHFYKATELKRRWNKPLFPFGSTQWLRGQIGGGYWPFRDPWCPSQGSRFSRVWGWLMICPGLDLTWYLHQCILHSLTSCCGLWLLVWPGEKHTFLCEDLGITNKGRTLDKTHIHNTYTTSIYFKCFVEPHNMLPLWKLQLHWVHVDINSKMGQPKWFISIWVK